MSEYQEEVLTNILDLQAELRGDEPEPSARPAKHDEKQKPSPAVDEGSDHPSDLAVSEDGVTISLASRRSAGLSVTDRIAALNERLDRLEYDLAKVTKRIERIEPAPETDPAESAGSDVDAPWRSFLDLQKIVADRLDHG